MRAVMIQIPNPDSTLSILLSYLSPSPGTPKIVITGFVAVLAADSSSVAGRRIWTMNEPGATMSVCSWPVFAR
jgi:hypothetical protein